jgi:hypothetical protein
MLLFSRFLLKALIGKILGGVYHIAEQRIRFLTPRMLASARTFRSAMLKTVTKEAPCMCIPQIYVLILQGGSNMTGTNCDLFIHK